VIFLFAILSSGAFLAPDTPIFQGDNIFETSFTNLNNPSLGTKDMPKVSKFSKVIDRNLIVKVREYTQNTPISQALYQSVDLLELKPLDSDLSPNFGICFDPRLQSPSV